MGIEIKLDQDKLNWTVHLDLENIPQIALLNLAVALTILRDELIDIIHKNLNNYSKEKILEGITGQAKLEKHCVKSSFELDKVKG